MHEIIGLILLGVLVMVGLLLANFLFMAVLFIAAAVINSFMWVSGKLGRK